MPKGPKLGFHLEDDGEPGAVSELDEEPQASSLLSPTVPPQPPLQSPMRTTDLGVYGFLRFM